MNAVRKFVIFVILSLENTYERARTWTRTLTESAQAVAREKSEGKKVWKRAEGRERGKLLQAPEKPTEHYQKNGFR